MASILGDHSTNLVSYWELEETSGTRVDSHGSNDLTDNNTVGYGTGIFGNCADFEADNSEYLSSTSASLRFNDDFSMSVWVKPESIPTRCAMFCTFTSAGGNRGLITALEQVGGVLKPRFANYIDPGTDKDYTWATTIPTNSWSHIVFTYDISAGEVTLYVNGAMISTVTGFPTSTETDMSSAIFGNDGNLGAGNWFDGLVEGLGIWQRVLSSGEVSAIYNAGDGIPYAAAASGPATLKTWNTIATASIKTMDTIAIASIKTIDTLA